VTFTLPGFTTLRREGIELTGTFTATINVELKVGAVAETVTVTGESPVVNIQSARREMTLNNDVLKAIPTVRSYNATVSVVPGVTTNLNDVVTATATTQFPIHGGRNNEGRLMIEGLNIGNPPEWTGGQFVFASSFVRPGRGGLPRRTASNVPTPPSSDTDPRTAPSQPRTQEHRSSSPTPRLHGPSSRCSYRCHR
jgi:hypothetical protein